MKKKNQNKSSTVVWIILSVIALGAMTPLAIHLFTPTPVVAEVEEIDAEDTEYTFESVGDATIRKIVVEKDEDVFPDDEILWGFLVDEVEYSIDGIPDLYYTNLSSDGFTLELYPQRYYTNAVVLYYQNMEGDFIHTMDLHIVIELESIEIQLWNFYNIPSMNSNAYQVVPEEAGEPIVIDLSINDENFYGFRIFKDPIVSSYPDYTLVDESEVITIETVTTIVDFATYLGGGAFKFDNVTGSDTIVITVESENGLNTDTIEIQIVA